MSIQSEDLEYQQEAIDAVVNVLDGQIRNTFDNSNLFGIHANTTSLTLLEQYIREKENNFDIQFAKDTALDEVLLKNDFMLNYTLAPCPEFTKNKVLHAQDAHKESLVCLNRELAPETVDRFKGDKQTFFICLELALDTTKKWNLKHHLTDRLNAI